MAGGTHIQNSQGVAPEGVGDVVFESLEITAPDARRYFGTRFGKPPRACLPSFLFFQERLPEPGFRVPIARRRNQFLLRQTIETDPQRRAARARLITMAEGVPSSPLISICNARNALTVASSICSSRLPISAPASFRLTAR